jgi:hypothetical protein
MQALQAVCSRAGITGPDADIATLSRYPCEGAAVVRLGATCDTPGAKLTCRLIFWDALGIFAAATAQVSFTADANPLIGALYLAMPDSDAWFPVGGPSAFSVHVDNVGGGTWTLTPMAQ